tara:strand:- start:45 stop:470 length:426 start_codon:yes stop_codon:yes gene_type:complete
MNFKSKNRDEFNLDITPLIDVVFLLLIFFMVSTTFKHESEINITLPSASNKTISQKPDAINIGLDLKGNIYVDGKKLNNSKFKTIESALIDRIKKLEKPPVIISADTDVKYQSVIYLLDTLRQLGLVKITYATQILEYKEK